MTDQQHPITPPDELFKQWEDDILNERDNVDHVLDCVWREAFRAGADQELEACCDWMNNNFDRCNSDLRSYWLRAARRPEPKSQAEEALEALSRFWAGPSTHDDWELTRSALERLRELEARDD